MGFQNPHQAYTQQWAEANRREQERIAAENRRFQDQMRQVQMQHDQASRQQRDARDAEAQRWARDQARRQAAAPPASGPMNVVSSAYATAPGSAGGRTRAAAGVVIFLASVALVALAMSVPRFRPGPAGPPPPRPADLPRSEPSPDRAPVRSPRRVAVLPNGSNHSAEELAPPSTRGKSAEPKVDRQRSLTDSFATMPRLTGRWSHGRYSDTLEIRVTHFDQQTLEFSGELSDPQSPEATKKVEGRIAQNLSRIRIKFVAKSGVKRQRVAVPMTLNLLTWGDNRSFDLTRTADRLEGKDEYGVAYAFRLEPTAPAEPSGPD